MLSNAVAYQDQMFHSYTGSSPYIGVDGHGQPSEFWRNESYANNIAASLEALVRIDPPDLVQGGYQYVGHP